MANTDFTPVVGALTGAGTTPAAPSGLLRITSVGALTLSALSPSYAQAPDEGPRFSHLKARQLGRYGRLIGFPKGRALITGLSVNPPSIAGNGGTGYVDVAVTGAKLSRKYRVVMIPPSTLDAGLEVTTCSIVANGLVRVSFYNTTDTAINDSARDWTAHLFSQVP